MLFVPRPDATLVQGFLLVTTTNGASVCACVCRPEHNLNDSIPQFLWISKAPEQHIKQRYNICDAAVHGIACVPPLQLVTPPGSQVYHIAKGNLVLLCTKRTIYAHRHFFFSSCRGSFLVLSVAGHPGVSRVHCGASPGPGRGLWHVLWGFKVARTGK